MVKFYLVNFRAHFKAMDLVIIGNIEQVKDYCERYATSYGSDYYIESESEQLTNEMQGLSVHNVCNLQGL